MSLPNKTRRKHKKTTRGGTLRISSLFTRRSKQSNLIKTVELTNGNVFIGKFLKSINKDITNFDGKFTIKNKTYTGKITFVIGIPKMGKIIDSNGNTQKVVFDDKGKMRVVSE
jgi:hypothetical protein